MAITTFSITDQTSTATEGSDTTDDPYQISTWENLHWVAQNTTSWDKHYIQTADITFPADIKTWDGGKGFLPIGNYDDGNFNESYDGQNFRINNLSINRPEESIVGLLGVMGAIR